METTKQIHAVIPVHAARAAQYPQPWLLLMRDKLSYGDVVGVVAYDDLETLGIEPLQEGFVIVTNVNYNLTLSSIAYLQSERTIVGSVPVSKWWLGMTIHDDPETIIVGV